MAVGTAGQPACHHGGMSVHNGHHGEFVSTALKSEHDVQTASTLSFSLNVGCGVPLTTFVFCLDALTSWPYQT